MLMEYTDQRRRMDLGRLRQMIARMYRIEQELEDMRELILRMMEDKADLPVMMASLRRDNQE